MRRMEGEWIEGWNTDVVYRSLAQAVHLVRSHVRMPRVYRRAREDEENRTNWEEGVMGYLKMKKKKLNISTVEPSLP